jgi:nitrite reductase/ring-hydroxylating ferredoxin subunit
MTTGAAPGVPDLVDGDRVDGRAYTDPTVYELELQRIFTDGWVFVGHESEVPGPGDYVTRRLGRDPVIMVRDRHDLVHVMANRCAHRGVSLVQQATGNVGSFHCIFHGWTYGLDGELRGVPQPGGMVTDRADCALDRPGQVDRYRGRGHVELEFWRGYDRQLAWLGIPRERVSDYCDALIAARGTERAEQLLWQGPPHALIFPNLFLGEMNLAIIDPVAADRTIHHHTPLLLDGVSESFNQRILRQSEAAMGPAGFLLPDDAAAAERMQIAFGCSGGWMDLSRGRNREHIDDEGHRVGHVSDEIPGRGFSRHWREVMTR